MVSLINESPTEVFRLESLVGSIAFLLSWKGGEKVFEEVLEKVFEEALLLNVLLK